MGEKLKEILKDGALAADIDLTDSQLDKFEKFYEHLIEKNKVMNLTAITDESHNPYFLAFRIVFRSRHLQLPSLSQDF